MVVQCCVCRRVRNENEWIVPEAAAVEQRDKISHGYCPRCAAQAFEEIKQIRAVPRKTPTFAV